MVTRERLRLRHSASPPKPPPTMTMWGVDLAGVTVMSQRFWCLPGRQRGFDGFHGLAVEIHVCGGHAVEDALEAARTGKWDADGALREHPCEHQPIRRDASSSCLFSQFERAERGR